MASLPWTKTRTRSWNMDREIPMDSSAAPSCNCLPSDHPGPKPGWNVQNIPSHTAGLTKIRYWILEQIPKTGSFSVPICFVNRDRALLHLPPSTLRRISWHLSVPWNSKWSISKSELLALTPPYIIDLGASDSCLRECCPKLDQILLWVDSYLVILLKHLL